MRGEARFQDRAEAGRKLADAIVEKGAPADPVVFALPRGGVPVAYEVACRLHAPLDLLFVRKIGAPGHPEYGIGAVVDGSNPQTVIDERAAAYSGATADYLESETKEQLAEIERRRAVYLGNRTPIDPAGRNVILVDDGIATGGTVKAGLKGLRQAGTASILLAVPVAPPDTLADLGQEVERIVSLYTPDRFGSVGAHYADFDQTTDEQVIRLLEKEESRRLAE
jgi:putative phosphoribosyl transferase